MIDDLGLVPTFRAKHNSNFRPGLALKWNLNFTLLVFQGKIGWVPAETIGETIE